MNQNLCLRYRVIKRGFDIKDGNLDLLPRDTAPQLGWRCHSTLNSAALSTFQILFEMQHFRFETTYTFLFSTYLYPLFHKVSLNFLWSIQKYTIRNFDCPTPVMLIPFPVGHNLMTQCWNITICWSPSVHCCPHWWSLMTLLPGTRRRRNIPVPSLAPIVTWCRAAAGCWPPLSYSSLAQSPSSVSALRLESKKVSPLSRVHVPTELEDAYL